MNIRLTPHYFITPFTLRCHWRHAITPPPFSPALVVTLIVDAIDADICCHATLRLSPFFTTLRLLSLPSFGWMIVINASLAGLRHYWLTLLSLSLSIVSRMGHRIPTAVYHWASFSIRRLSPILNGRFDWDIGWPIVTGTTLLVNTPLTISYHHYFWLSLSFTNTTGSISQFTVNNGPPSAEYFLVAQIYWLISINIDNCHWFHAD